MSPEYSPKLKARGLKLLRIQQTPTRPLTLNNKPSTLAATFSHSCYGLGLQLCISQSAYTGAKEEVYAFRPY